MISFWTFRRCASFFPAILSKFPFSTISTFSTGALISVQFSGIRWLSSFSFSLFSESFTENLLLATYATFSAKKQCATGFPSFSCVSRSASNRESTWFSSFCATVIQKSVSLIESVSLCVLSAHWLSSVPTLSACDVCAAVPQPLAEMLLHASSSPLPRAVFTECSLSAHTSLFPSVPHICFLCH